MIRCVLQVISIWDSYCMGLCTSFGLAFYWPTDIDLSGPFKGGPSDHIFTLISCPLHPMGLSSFSRWTWGVMVQEIGGWWFKTLGNDGSKVSGSMVKIRTSWTTSTPNKLSGSHYDTRHVSLFDWILTRIEASFCLPCTPSINMDAFLSHFSIFSWNTLSKCNHHPCQRPLHPVTISIINTPFILKIGKCSLFS